MADMDVIIEDQKGLLEHLKRTARSFESKTTKTRGFAQSILEEIEITTQNFKRGHSQVLATVRENIINTNDIPYFKDEVYYKFQDEFFSLKSQLIDLLYETPSSEYPNFQSSTFAVPSNSRNETLSVQARLPKIDLPEFSGDYLAWISYKDMFVSLVHSNSALSGVQKYYFLKGSCKGTPLDIVNEYPASDNSYALRTVPLFMSTF